MNEPVTASEAAEIFFGEDSPLKRAYGSGFEARPAQRELALAVARTLDSCGRLCAEAPTGVGKTMAYLLPAAWLAGRTRMPAVVSTHSIGLQDQIVSKDAPALSKALGRKVAVASAKGKGNYLCLLRLKYMAEGGSFLKRGGCGPSWFASLAAWADGSPDGDRSSFRGDPAFWHLVSCEFDGCEGRSCEFYRECFLTRARQSLADADVIVANHAVVFAAMAQGWDSILPQPSSIVMDEAHAMEDAAAEKFGSDVMVRDVASCLKAAGMAEAAKDAEEHFRKSAEDMALRGLSGGPMRVRKGDLFPEWIAWRMDEASRKAKDEAARLSAIAVCRSLRLAERGFRSGWAAWLGGDPDGKANIHARPVDASDMMRGGFPKGVPVIAVSATLAAGGSVEMFAKRNGMEGAEPLVLPATPPKGVKAYAARDIPPPTAHEAYLAASFEALAKFLPKSRGGAFVLFTSFGDISRCADAMGGFMKRNGMDMVVQRKGDQPHALLKRYLSAKRPVLLGNASFWTGVDIPGDRLSMVVVMKLPFPSPSEPLEEARAEHAGGGKEGFMAYSAPKAALMLRQGLGRLIRRKGDRGVMVVMDSRMVRKQYGRMFLEALPVEPEMF